VERWCFIKQEVITTITRAINELKPQWGMKDIPPIEVEIPRDEAFGDLATTVAMSLAKILKKPTRKIAEEIVNAIKTIPLTPLLLKGGEGGLGIFERIEIAGNGFINFTFKRDYWYEFLRKLLKEGQSILRVDIGHGKKVQIEFVSANPTGPLHIGHGRGAAVGNALANLLSASGYEVEREYYINDAGKQVELLGLSVYTRYQQKLGNEIPFPEDGYRGGYVDELVDEIINERGNRYLDVPHDECLDFFKDFSYKKMLKNIELDLSDFGIAFDRWQSELELYERGRVDDAIAALKHRGHLYERDGALWFRSTVFGDDKDRVVLKQGGEYTYFASDIAYHKNKLNRGFDSLIDIWGADHHGYVSRINSVLKALGHPEKTLRILLVQMVTLLRHGKPVQMSKRAGEFVTLREVINEVGADTAKFMFLTKRSDSHLDFDLDIAKEQSAENPVYYVQYAFARIASIFRQAIEKRVLSSESDVMDVDCSSLKEDEEISIIKKLAQYPIVFEGAVMALEPHRITYYLQGLAGLFHSYYNKYRVVSENKELTLARLSLCRAVQMVLGEGMRILGVHAPERM